MKKILGRKGYFERHRKEEEEINLNKGFGSIIQKKEKEEGCLKEI